MRFGAPLYEHFNDPESWIAVLKGLGYSAAYCPVNTGQSEAVIEAYAKAAEKADIIIAEVGAWSNPLSDNQEIREKAIAHIKRQLAFADKIGARCCVNIAGSRGEQWDGPHKDNLTLETFARIVDLAREIIDEVKPLRTFYTLEPMPWVYPDSINSYLKLIEAVDRKAFAVHLDPVNIITSPQLYFNNADFLRECFKKLGPWIKSCHAKDITLGEKLTVHLEETRPGLGNLDYRVLLKEMDKLDPNCPLLLEHLPSKEEYDLAARYVRGVAEEAGVLFK